MTKKALNIKRKLIPGSRVPISFLIDYIHNGYSLIDFLADYPWVKKANFLKALDEMKNKSITSQYAA